VPKYDFKCSTCGGQQEIYKEFGDDALPICCGESMSKVYSVPAAHFKGGGWGGQ